jgi:hypothetical protein
MNTFKDLINDSILTINNQLERNLSENLTPDECQRNIYNTTMIIIDAIHNQFNADDHIYYTRLLEVLSLSVQISYETYYENANEDLLGLFKNVPYFIPNVQKLEENNLPLKTDEQKLEEKIIDILFRLQYFIPYDPAYEKINEERPCIICRQNLVSKTSGHVIHDYTRRKWELILCCVKCKELPKKTNDRKRAIDHMRNNTNLVTDEEMTLLMNESSYRHKLKYPELYISKK